MGQDLSKVTAQFECTNVERQILDLVDEDSLTTETRSISSDEEFLTPLSSSEAGGRFGGDAVIIFDWDDTLLCSSAINHSNWTLKELRELETVVESVLNAAMSLGETLIVTNGNATWIQDSAKRFLPRLVPTLAKLECISARALNERQYPGDPYMWKQAAFKSLLIKDRPVDLENGLNLIAVGDQLPEIEAAYYVVNTLGPPSRTKTVKFKEQPSIPELLGQLRRTARELPRLIAEETSGNRCLVRRELPAHLEGKGMASQAAGWKFSNKDPDASNNRRGAPRSLSLALKDLWPLFS